MNLLLTGASGFLGRNFQLAAPADWKIYAVYCTSAGFPAFLARRGLAWVEPLRCDLTASGDVRALRARMPERLDAILHLAANGDPAVSVRDPGADLRAATGSLVNLLGTFTCDRLVYVSSGAVYDGLKGLVSPDTPVNPTLPYAISRVATEHYVRFFRREGRVGTYVILRFFGAYGPWEPARKIYTRLVRWATGPGDEPFEVRGDGRNLIDAMYVDDAVRGLYQALTAPVADETVDFGGGAPVSVNELVETAARTFGREPRIRHVGAVPEYIEFFVSPEKMARLYGFRPEVGLADGLRRLRDHLCAPEASR